MGRNKLFAGMAIGAIIGGLVTLIDGETRVYTKRKVQSASRSTKAIIKNPSSTIRQAKETFTTLNEKMNKGTQEAINALEQAEDALGKLSNRRKS